jgi:fibronectin-binding autotransporter adhesin
MPGLRSTARVLLGVFALLVTMAWVPATALATDISIISAGADSNGNPYDFTVQASDSTYQISTMTVNFLQGQTNVYSATMQYSSGPDSDQVWTPNPVIPAASLPAGTYTVTVNASDPAESDTLPIPSGTFVVAYSATNVTVTPNETTVTEGSQPVSFTGTVMGTAQDGNSTQVPITGVSVTVSTAPDNPVTTNASGQFSFTAGTVSQTTTFGFSVSAASDGSYPAGSASSTISAVAATTNISVTPSEMNVSQGAEQIIFSGTVTAAPVGGGAPVPVPGATVSVSGGGSAGQTTTLSDGSFTYEATGISAAASISFTVAGTSLYGPGSATVPIGTAASATSITGLAPSQTFVTQGANSLTFSGTVTVTPPGSTTPVGIGSGIPVDLSIGGVQQGQVTTTSDAAGDFSYEVSGITQSTDYDFSVSGTSLYGPASADISVPAEAAATTISVTPSQSSIELGSQNVTLNGSVTMTPPNSPPGTTPVSVGAGVPVTITGGSTNTTVTTDSNGGFSLPVSAIPAATTFSFSVGGTSLYGSSSYTVPITVQQAQTVINIPSPPVITFGSPNTTISGTVTGVPPGQTTALPISGANVYLDGDEIATTGADGSFSYQVTGITSTTTYSFTVAAGALYSAPSAVQVSAAVAAGATTMTVTPSPATVNSPGQTVAFTGLVQVTPAGTGTAPGPIGGGVPVTVSVDGGSPQPAGTTNSLGVFTDTLSNVNPGDDFKFSVAGAPLYITASDDVGFGEESTTLTVTPTQTSVTEGSQSVTFNGTVTGKVEGGTPVPVPDAPVDLNGKQVTSTDTAGTFAVTVSGIAAATDYDFSVAGTHVYTSGDAAVPIGLNQAPTRITDIRISPPKLKYGQKATLTGTVQYQSAQKIWTNLGGTTVILAEGKASLGTAKASKIGTFSATLPTTHGFGWNATVNASVLTQQTSAVGNLIISVPLAVRSFGANLDVQGDVSASGCLTVTVPVKYGPMTNAELQYASTARGRWRLLGRLQLHNDDRKARSCSGPNQSYFSGAIRAAADNAYYRAVFMGNNSFQGTTSVVIHSWRYPTKITGFKLSAKSITTKQRVTITGQLWHKTGKSWQPYAHRTIVFSYNQKGTTYWHGLGSVTTNSKGAFSQVVAGGDGNFTVIIYAEYEGSRTDLATRTAGIPLAIRQSSAVSSAASPGVSLATGLAASAAQQQMLGDEAYLLLGVLPPGTPII